MRERIISEIRRLTLENGVVPGARSFEKATAIRRREWEGRIWARWSDALLEAGHKPNSYGERLDPNEMLTQIAESCLAYGKFPSDRETELYARQNPGFPSRNAIRNHFVNRATLAAALAEWALKNPKYSDIVDILPTLTKAETTAINAIDSGHVYLIRAGDFYKIGRSAELERRVKEIRIALPQAATLEHTIATDDPPGIEAYWHRRFAGSRANGEWFQLAKADVLAFKKRKFQ